MSLSRLKAKLCDTIIDRESDWSGVCSASIYRLSPVSAVAAAKREAGVFARCGRIGHRVAPAVGGEHRFDGPVSSETQPGPSGLDERRCYPVNLALFFFGFD